jgi:hypothetical protein
MRPAPLEYEPIIAFSQIIAGKMYIICITVCFASTEAIIVYDAYDSNENPIAFSTSNILKKNLKF